MFLSTKSPEHLEYNIRSNSTSHIHQLEKASRLLGNILKAKNKMKYWSSRMGTNTLVKPQQSLIKNFSYTRSFKTSKIGHAFIQPTNNPLLKVCVGGGALHTPKFYTIILSFFFWKLLNFIQHT